jgi:hypothetical protein
MIREEVLSIDVELATQPHNGIGWDTRILYVNKCLVERVIGVRENQYPFLGVVVQYLCDERPDKRLSSSRTCQYMASHTYRPILGRETAAKRTIFARQSDGRDLTYPVDSE